MKICNKCGKQNDINSKFCAYCGNSEWQKKKNRKLVPYLVMIAGVIMLIVSLVVPLKSSVGEYKEYLQEYSEYMFFEEMKMTNKEAVNISLVEEFLIYFTASQNDMYVDISVTCMVMIGIYAFCVLLTSIFVLAKVPIPSIIFTIISFASFSLLKWDYEARGVIPTNHYIFGAAPYICYAGIFTVLAGSIIFIIMRTKERNALQA